jgi:hypothetical protein
MGTIPAFPLLINWVFGLRGIYYFFPLTPNSHEQFADGDRWSTLNHRRYSLDHSNPARENPTPPHNVVKF